VTRIRCFWSFALFFLVSVHPGGSMAAGRVNVMPLEAVLDQIRDSVQGDIIGVELERENGRWVYEVKVAAPDRRVIELYLDARTGAVISKSVRRKRLLD